MDTPKRTSPGAVVACKESTCFLRKSAFGHRWNLHLSRHARNLRHGIACASVRNCVLFAACNLHRMVMIFHACHDSGAKWKIAEGAENHLISLSCSCWSRIERTQNLHHCAMRCFKGQARTGIFEPWHSIPPISPCFHRQHLRLHRSRGNRANALRSSSGSSMSSGSKSSLLEANGPLMALVSNVGVKWC